MKQYVWPSGGPTTPQRVRESKARGVILRAVGATVLQPLLLAGAARCRFSETGTVGYSAGINQKILSKWKHWWCAMLRIWYHARKIDWLIAGIRSGKCPLCFRYRQTGILSPASSPEQRRTRRKKNESPTTLVDTNDYKPGFKHDYNSHNTADYASPHDFRLHYAAAAAGAAPHPADMAAMQHYTMIPEQMLVQDYPQPVLLWTAVAGHRRSLPRSGSDLRRILSVA